MVERSTGIMHRDLDGEGSACHGGEKQAYAYETHRGRCASCAFRALR